MTFEGIQLQGAKNIMEKLNVSVQNKCTFIVNLDFLKVLKVNALLIFVSESSISKNQQNDYSSGLSTYVRWWCSHKCFGKIAGMNSNNYV